MPGGGCDSEGLIDPRLQDASLEMNDYGFGSKMLVAMADTLPVRLPPAPSKLVTIFSSAFAAAPSCCTI